MSAQLLQVARALLWQSGQAPTDAALERAWDALRASGAEPTLTELFRVLREQGALTGTLLAPERPRRLASSQSIAAARTRADDEPEVATTTPQPAALAPDEPAQRRAAPADQPAGATPTAAPRAWSYELLEPIGQGAMGTVFLAYDRELLRQAAVKQVRAQGPEATARFVHESQVLSQLDHPHILPVYAFRQEGDEAAACALKLIRGGTLADVIREHRSRGPTFAAEHAAERLEMFLKLCEGVAYAHAHGVIHRDIKPENVMIGEHGEVYLADWGLCKLLYDARDPDPGGAAPPPEPPPQVGVELERTLDGGLRGTPLYFSPEQARGDTAAVGPRSDQFALGLVLYELLALQCAYAPTDLEGVLAQARAAQKRPWPDPTQADPDLTAIVDKATALESAARYTSVRALGEDLRRWLRGLETEARPDDARRRLVRRLRRHAGGVVLSLVVLLAALLSTGVGLVVRRRLVEADARAQARQRDLQEHEALLILQRLGQRLVERFVWYQTQLEGVASATEMALVNDLRADGPIYDARAFTDPATAPPDLQQVPEYGVPISPSWPLCVAPTSSDPALVERDARRLLSARQRLLAVFRDARESLSAPRSDLRPGTFVEWAYVATEGTGTVVVVPGAKSEALAAADFDLRQGVVYQSAIEAQRAGHLRGWSRPYVDQLGQGWILAATRVLLAPDGQRLGVAGIDLALDHVARHFLTEPGVRWAGILDSQGRVLVSVPSSHPPLPEAIDVTAEPPPMPTYARPQVLARLEANRGLLELREGDDDLIVAWERLDPLPWTLLIER